MGAGTDASVASMFPRKRMLVIAVPATRKQVSARMVIAFVKQLSCRASESLPLKLGVN
jgi:hypothetical protein